MSSKKIVTFMLCIIAFFSCVNNIDFTQIEDYSITPEYTASLTHFTILPKQFFDTNGVQQSEKTDVTEFRVFENTYLKNYLVKVDFNVEIKNEFDRDFTIQIDFLDNNNSPTHTFKEIKVSANNLDYKFTETIEVSTNSNVKRTTKVQISVKMDTNTTPLDATDLSEFELKSSVKIYIDTDA